MEQYLVDLTPHKNQSHYDFYEHYNACVRKAWERTDDSLTRVSAGYYIVRVADELHELTKHENGQDWMTQECNAHTSNLWSGSVADFRKWAEQVNHLYRTSEFKRVTWRDGSQTVQRHSVYNMGCGGYQVVKQERITIWEYLEHNPVM